MGKQARLKAQRRQEGFEKLQRERERVHLSHQGRLYDELCREGVIDQSVVIDLTPLTVAFSHNWASIVEYASASSAGQNINIPSADAMPIIPQFPSAFYEWVHETGRMGILVKLEPNGTQKTAYDRFDRRDVTLTPDYSGSYKMFNRPDVYDWTNGFGHDIDIVGNRWNDWRDAWDVLQDAGSFVFDAIRFLNCKNVELIDHAPEPKLSERYEREFGVPMTTYKTLRIKPVRKQYESADSESDGAAAKKRLHIVRGHIATYTDAAPLFGKYVGQYWIPAHVRGDEQRGMVVKDYEVEAGG